MKSTLKEILENKISSLYNQKFFSYGKSRVAGSKQINYLMHSRSVCMPGQTKCFVSTSTSILNHALNKDFLQIRKIYQREKYQNQKYPIGSKSQNTSLEAFTYKSFSPYDDQSLAIAIIATYKQIFGNLPPMESQLPIDLIRRLRNGDIPIREFIRGLAKSEFYRSNYLEKCSQKQLIEINFMQLLGRPVVNKKELEKHIKIIHENGFESHIDYLINSLEYEEFFGEDIVPYQRHWNSPCGATTESFLKTASFNKGFASSDSVTNNKGVFQ